jgi:HEXXH motif-containing protein
MTGLQLDGFSCPQEPFDETLLDVLGAEHVRHSLRLFVDRAGETLDRAAEGVAGALRAGAADAVGFDVLWDPALSALAPAVPVTGAHELRQRAVAAALRLTNGGVATPWRVSLPEPATFDFGHWMLKDVTGLEVARNGTWRLRATLASGAVAEGGREADRWALRGASEHPVVRLGRNSTTIACSDGAPLAAALEAAIELLRAHAPEYLVWVDRVIRRIDPVTAEPGRMQSGSSTARSGAVEMSFGCSTAAIAEMLVHEASHQYLHLLTRLDDVDDGSDASLYYSPVKGTGRPIRAILVAYHAFANVLLMYRRCLAAGADPDGYFARSVERTERELAQLDQALETTTALTEVGEALWLPLRKRVAL